MYAIQVDKKWKAGYYIGAEEAVRSTRIWLIISVIVGLLLIAVSLIANVLFLNPPGGGGRPFG